jgi:hexosaminidase
VLALDGRRDKNIQLPFRRRGEKPGCHDKFKRAMIGKYVLFSLIRLPDLYNGETGGDNTLRHDLLPVPAQLTWHDGEIPIDSMFTVGLAGRIDPRIDNAIQRWVERLEKKLGGRLQSPHPSNVGRAQFLIQYESEGKPVQALSEDESYTLTVTPDQALLKAPNPLGILRGLETFLQLIRTNRQGHTVPAISIQDRPRFAWRGLLIDASRHWQPVEVIKRNLDGMAAVKMNVLHWHLSDDQGFRIQSKTFPKLHELGSEGNYYTQEQVREMIAYARQRGIRILPEFDMPGHVTSWLVGHPELASAPGPYQIERTFGIKDPTFDPTREEVYRFVNSFMGEMAALFPDDYMHIGGDEVNGNQWNQNPKIQEFIREHNLKDNHGLQAYFNSRLSQILTRHGKIMVGWDEVLHPDLPKSTIVHSWRGPTALAESARKEYDGILSHGYYLDLMLPASYHYGIDPASSDSDLTSDQKAHVLGGEAAMWTEYASSETIHSRIWPRAAAIAERLWSAADIRDVAEMYRRLEVQNERLEELGLTHRPTYSAMLQRLVGNQPVEPFKVLADVVEPVKYYARGDMRAYTTETPLDRLVDAARPESDLARRFRNSVDELLREAPNLAKSENIRSLLAKWRENDMTLGPILDRSEKASEALPLSRDLSNLGRLGLEALEFLSSGKAPDPKWQEDARGLLEGAQKPKAEVEIALIPAIRKLVLAAGQQDKLKALSPEDWNSQLDDQVEAARPKRHE